MESYWFETAQFGQHSIMAMYAKCRCCNKTMSVDKEKESYICVPCAKLPTGFPHLTTPELISEYRRRLAV